MSYEYLMNRGALEANRAMREQQQIDRLDAIHSRLNEVLQLLRQVLREKEHRETGSEP